MTILRHSKAETVEQRVRRRAHAERPFAKFTDEELSALDELLKISPILRADIQEATSALVALLVHEMAERDCQAELSALSDQAAMRSARDPADEHIASAKRQHAMRAKPGHRPGDAR